MELYTLRNRTIIATQKQKKYNVIRRVLLYTINIVKLMGPTGATKQLA